MTGDFFAYRTALKAIFFYQNVHLEMIYHCEMPIVAELKLT